MYDLAGGGRGPFGRRGSEPEHPEGYEPEHPGRGLARAGAPYTLNPKPQTFFFFITLKPRVE